jgi:hypothetical protein
MNIIDELVAKGVSGEVILAVAKLIADAEVTERIRAAARERMRSVRERSRTHANGSEQGGILTSFLDRPLKISQEEQVELVAPATPASEKYHPEFLKFYAAYPRKEGKGAAYKAWQRAISRGVTNDALLEGAERYRDDPNREPSFTKHPATWLNAGCHDDEPLPKRGGQDGRQGRRPDPKEDPRSIRGAIDRLFAKLEGPDEAGDLPREPNLRVVSGRSGERP